MERGEQILSFQADLESVASTASHVFNLNHLEEAEKNLRASQIDLVGSGVRILDILFLVCVFRRRPAEPQLEKSYGLEKERGRKGSDTGLEARTEPRPEGGSEGGGGGGGGGVDGTETEEGGEEDPNLLNAEVLGRDVLPGLGTEGDGRRRARL